MLKKDSVPTLFLRGKETAWIRDGLAGKNEKYMLFFTLNKSLSQKLYETKSKQKKIKSKTSFQIGRIMGGIWDLQ